jgi:hypothetical protein
MKFFTNNLSITSDIPIIDNDNDFHFLRSHLLNKPTITEDQIASRIANTFELINDNTAATALHKTRLVKNSKYINNLIIHYTHENRL